jgi:hypothetical protein
MTRLATTEDYLVPLVRDAGIVELRHEQTGRWTTGWFNDPGALLAAAHSLWSQGNLYTSLNAPKLRPARNVMGQGAALRDNDVAFVTRLPFDFDPVRPAGVCSTDAELECALVARDRLVRYLSKLRWPLPLHAKSGNGFHAQYRVRLRNDDATREMLRVLYAGLHAEFADHLVEFDRTVRSPGQIFRLYGSVNRKGRNTKERPHRVSTVWIPPRWQQVPAPQIEQLAEYYAKRLPGSESRNASKCVPASVAAGAGDYRTLDVVAWFTAHRHYKRPLADGKHAVRCPWVHEHSTQDQPQGTATIVFEADGGWPGFHCSHAHCAGRDVRDVMQLWGDQDAFCAARFGEEVTTC